MLEYLKFKQLRELFIQGHFEAARRLLMALQARYIALHDEISVLKQQVREFEESMLLSQNLVMDGEQYWLCAGGVRHGPFCKPCYEYAGKLIRLEGRTRAWRCPYCGLLSDRKAASGAALLMRDPLPLQGKIIHFSMCKIAAL